MNPLKPLTALGKYFLRKSNDADFNRRNSNAHNVAYEKTGKELRKASRQGKTLNGSKVYRKNLQNIRTENKQRHERRDKFISDL